MDAARSLRLGNIREMMVFATREIENIIHDLMEEDSATNADALLVGAILSRGITTIAIHAGLFVEHAPSGLDHEIKERINAAVDEILYSSTEVTPLEFISHQAESLRELTDLLEDVEDAMRESALKTSLGSGNVISDTDIDLLLER